MRKNRPRPAFSVFPTRLWKANFFHSFFAPFPAILYKEALLMANNILEMALELLEHEQKFLPSTLSAWFGDATVVSFTDNRLVLHSPSDFKQKYITDKFIEPLQNALYQLTGEAATVVVVTGEYNTPSQSA